MRTALAQLFNQYEAVRLDVNDCTHLPAGDGVIVHCRRRRETLDAPLADLECTDEQSANYELVKDYAVWFANR